MSDILTPKRIRECGLQSDSLPVLERARSVGEIHISDVRRMTLPELSKDPERLRTAMVQLVRTLGECNIRIEYNGVLKPVPPAHRTGAATTVTSVPFPTRSSVGRKRGRSRKPQMIPSTHSGEEVAPLNPNREEISSLQRFFNDMGRFRVLTYEETLEYFRRIKAGDEQASKEFTASNIRLVISMARKYAGNDMNLLLELTQEGNIGLMKAVEKFKPERGFYFSTYATWWIRQAISRALADKGRTIRLPVHVVELIRRIAKAEKVLEQMLERPPTLEELAEELDVSESRIEQVRRAARMTASLDAERDFHSGKAGGGGSATYYDEVHDRNALSPATLAEAKDELEHLCRKIIGMFERLKQSPGYRKAYTRMTLARAGLDGNHELRTLEEVGAMFGVTRERIRQVEAKLIKRLDWIGYKIGGVDNWLRLVKRVYELEEILDTDVSASFK